MERVDGAQARLKRQDDRGHIPLGKVERVDGAQARLKLGINALGLKNVFRGKGGWGSGEIETVQRSSSSNQESRVERVDGAQARLKPLSVLFSN